MEKLMLMIKNMLKQLMYTFLSLILLIIILLALEKAVDYFFDYAAAKDTCLDFGKGWDDKLKKCKIE